MSAQDSAKKKVRLALIYSATFSVVGILIFLLIYMIVHGGDFNLSGNAHCYLHGMMRPKYNQGKEDDSLYNMLRLNFDAADKEKCERMITSYCEYNVRKEGYSPRDLKGIFKPDISKSETFNYYLTESCKLEQVP